MAYIFPPVRLLEFVLGVLLALDVQEDRWFALRSGPALSLVAGSYAVAMYLPHALVWVAVMVVPFTLLLGAVASRDGRRGQAPAWLSSRTMIAAGTWSYSLYLVHPIVIEVYLRISGLFRRPALQSLSGPSILMHGSAIILASVAASWLLFTVVERPAERLLRASRISPASTEHTGWGSSRAGIGMEDIR